MSKLEVVKQKKYKGQAKGDLEPVTCPKCLMGLFVVTESGVFRKKGQSGWLKDTYKSLTCVACLANGEVVTVEYN